MFPFQIVLTVPRAPTCKCFHPYFYLNASILTTCVVSRGYGSQRLVPHRNAVANILIEDLLRGVYGYGYESPSAVQSRAIMQICKGRGTTNREFVNVRCHRTGYVQTGNILTTAQSGTGKTATFSISILQTINTTQRETQALVLSPTRELATQIQSVILALGEYLNV
jgi:ATP-dependent RNA helicase